MTIEILTKEDLEKVKMDIIQEIKQLLSANPVPNKQWLKSAEVRKMLSISPGTLQNLRINGTLNYTKIAGTMYYKTADINKMLNANE
jgi:hypothetical protein